MSTDQLGTPLTAPFPVPGGTAKVFEHAVVIDGAGGEVVVSLDLPMIGRPAILTGDEPGARPFEPDTVNFRAGGWDLEQLTAAIISALTSRISFVGLDQTVASAYVVPERVEVVVPAQEPGVGGIEIPAVYGVVLSLSGPLQDRTLYNAAVLGDDDSWHVVAPHALYFRQSWTDFGLAHITDMHVARRIDTFRTRLNGLGRGDAAARMVNWNDRFRGFVRYANFLHSTGALDVIVATGDLFDFILDRGDSAEHGGNAAFLRGLVLGREPGPEFPDVEELKVPIFMVPGNHDYRKNPYDLIFDVHLGWDWFGKDLARIKNFSGYLLLQEDAQALAQSLAGGSGTDVRNVDRDAAASMVEVDAENLPYKRFLADRGSYVVKLGKHRVAMIDSSWDVGMVTDLLDALRGLIGMQSEDETTFVGGSPNCEGVRPEELAMTADALRETPDDGLFMVGLHAPLFNVWNSEYPYFLRETQRPEQGGQAHAFLARQAPPIFSGSVEEQVEGAHPLWFAGDRDHRAPRFVKRVDSQDLLDYGVSRGEAEAIMLLLAGIGSRRPADVVLAGHTHRHNEFSVRPMPTGELAYYMDYFTYNPARAYPTRFTIGWVAGPAAGGAQTMQPTTEVTYVEVIPGADPDQTPWPMPYDAYYDDVVQVPPYATPLSTAPDPRAWWAEHRPLVLQTGALGPMESSQVSFSGFRLLAVKGDVIDKIHFISIERLEINQFRLPLEDAVRPDPVRQHLYVERSRPLNPPKAAGSPSGVTFPALGVTNVVYRDGEGRLHELWQKGTERGTSNLTDLADNATRAASDPYSYIAAAEGLEVALYRGVDGHVHSVYWSTGAVGRDALSGPIGAPQAVGRPVGYVGPDGISHVIYRTDGGHLSELWWSGPNPPGHGDLTEVSGAPAASGDPSAYINPNTNENIVVYRGDDGHIHSMYWSTGDVGHDGLSAYAGSPVSAGDPVAYYTAINDAHQVAYRGQDGHLYELWWVGAAPVQYWDVTAGAFEAPAAVSDPAACYHAGTNTKHLVYVSADGHLNDIAWAPGGTPTWTDLSVWALAPLAVGQPSVFTVEGPNTVHAVYRGKDDQIHEIRWVPSALAASTPAIPATGEGTWQAVDLGTTQPKVITADQIITGGFFQPG